MISFQMRQSGWVVQGTLALLQSVVGVRVGRCWGQLAVLSGTWRVPRATCGSPELGTACGGTVGEREMK